MADRDTEIGPGGPAFPSTRWSIVIGARDRRTPECRDSLGRLIELYWRPIYVYIRAAWQRSSEDAKDLTQEFLARLAEGGLLEKYDRDKGRFRAYLKGALRHFLLDEEKATSRQKRGGGRALLSLDFEGVDVPSGAAPPEEQFDRSWAGAVLQEAVEELGRQLRREGRELGFQVYERYEFPPAGAPEMSYGELGRALGISETEVRAHLSYARLRLRKILRERVADTVTSEEELFRELKELFEK